ncbi:MAG: PHP domain protein [Candidatus Daviesbacteria bacterium GW2011_GWA2_38_24]|uniref:PHP domain protein n=1 Tax=Candidatus Daviesbacteria bacterium GW2011_GWA2_38_24 TaxID=1618422 RepID=A0A0G0JHH1_9BACT|nr:MAG: PHP domain protein [Candidatus Daviesbacteria bacterium GW2011_GWA2_38_24]KKQ80143.1 MAG: PHP domain protein [Candidatus Daviesbacteria bacterium GW2011_GWA1_38_7]
MAKKYGFNNQEIAKLLRDVAAALTLKNVSIFQIRAYETAADAIEHSTAEVKDLWEEEKLDQVPGIGKNIQSHLDELFKAGRVKHFEVITKGLPPVFFDLLEIPEIGPKTAKKIVDTGIKSIDDLRNKIENGVLLERGFTEKTLANIFQGLSVALSEKGRILLPIAFAHAERILDNLKSSKDVLAVEALGSLRRRVATIGDLDFAVSSKHPEKVVGHFINMPDVIRVMNKGREKATVLLKSGFQADLLVGAPESFGAILQHFTGSKQHNIHLRGLAEERGYSISEHGVKDLKHNKLIEIPNEDRLYKLLNMQTPPPELREDTNEIDAALKYELPKLVEYGSIKGDLHTHSDFPLEPSHGPGVNSIQEIVKKAIELNYEYIGISDHSPSVSNHSEKEIINLIEKRTNFIEDIKYSGKSVRVINGLEIDILPNGKLSVPDEALKTLDYVIAGIHSSHRMEKDKMTQRILNALKNPYVDILAHPTGRLLNQRDSYDADWEPIFKFCAQNKKLLEINSFPDRLDLRDDLVRMAIGFGVKLIIDSDAHEVSQMENIKFGIAVARRGWATEEDIVNTWDWKKFSDWFNIKS